MGFLHLAFLRHLGGNLQKVLFSWFPRGLDWLYNSRFLWRVHDTHALNFTVATLALVAFRRCGLRCQDSRLPQPFLRSANESSSLSEIDVQYPHPSTSTSCPFLPNMLAGGFSSQSRIFVAFLCSPIGQSLGFFRAPVADHRLCHSPHAAHMHPPPMPGQGPPLGPPGALSPDMPGPTESIPVHRINEMYMQQKQSVNDRLEADGRGYDSVFAQ